MGDFIFKTMVVADEINAWVMVFFDMSPKSTDSWPETWKSPDWKGFTP